MQQWIEVGKPINKLRGYALLTCVYVLANVPERAMHYAEAGLRLSDQLADDQTPFDRAGALGGMAIALGCTGRSQEAKPYRAQLQAAAADLAQPSETELIDRLYSPA